jgi:hypothetical protein
LGEQLKSVTYFIGRTGKYFGSKTEASYNFERWVKGGINSQIKREVGINP